jgi:predicted AAA+ superfamily ATPase
MFIQRQISQRVRRLAQLYPVVLLTGARQTGKTTLLRELYPDSDFVTLDLPSAAYEAETNSQSFLGGFQSSSVVLDEVQYAPSLFRFLKIAVDADRHRMGRFLMTGSQRFALMGAVSESLAGRCGILDVDTLSCSELFAADPALCRDPLTCIQRGGYPEIWRVPDLQTHEFFPSYLATYLERDVRQILNVNNLRDLEKFLRICATRSGNVVNFSAIGRELRVADTTIRNWMNILETSNVIQLLPPYFSNPNKTMIKAPKLYFKDTGLLCFLLGISSVQQLQQSPFRGAVWETFILGQIQRHLVVSGQPASLYFWRDTKGTEVDFVLWIDGRAHLIECKWAENCSDPRDLHSMQNVIHTLGQAAASTHLLVSRTANDHWHPHHSSVRVVNGFHYTDWLTPMAPPDSMLMETPTAYTIKRSRPRYQGRGRPPKSPTKTAGKSRR